MSTSLKADDMSRAQRCLGKIEGSSDVVDITERIGDEIRKGKLDVDAALSVIENKRRM